MREIHTPPSTPLQSDQFNNLLRFVNLASGLVTTLAGGSGGVIAGHADGAGTAAAFNSPHGIAADAGWTVAIVVRKKGAIVLSATGVGVGGGGIVSVWLECGGLGSRHHTTFSSRA